MPGAGKNLKGRVQERVRGAFNPGRNVPKVAGVNQPSNRWFGGLARRIPVRIEWRAGSWNAWPHRAQCGEQSVHGGGFRRRLEGQPPGVGSVPNARIALHQLPALRRASQIDVTARVHPCR